MRRVKLRREEGEDGTIHVVLEGSEVHQDSDGRETVQDSLVEVLSEQVSYIRGQLDKQREANRENPRLLAAALERIPGLEPAREASSEPREPSQTSSEQQGSVLWCSTRIQKTEAQRSCRQWQFSTFTA